MVRACVLGMCTGEYVFVYTWLGTPADQEWKQGDEFDDVAKEAYKYMIWVLFCNVQIYSFQVCLTNTFETSNLVVISCPVHLPVHCIKFCV